MSLPSNENTTVATQSNLSTPTTDTTPTSSQKVSPIGSTTTSTPSIEEKPKDELVGISLRPGSSFFGNFSKKPQTSSTTSSLSTTTSYDSQPPLKPNRPAWKDNQDTKPSKPKEQTSTSGLKDVDKEFTFGEPFTSKTILEKQVYDRTFLKKFQMMCTEVSYDLEQALQEFPEIQPKSQTYGNFSSRPDEEKSARVNLQSQNRAPKFNKQPFNQQPQQQQQQQRPRPPPGLGNPPKGALVRRAENPWAPRLAFLKDEKDQVLRDIKGILNKITPEKFPKLSEKIQALFGQITEDDIFAHAISLVFAKAVSEPNFSKLYAELCVKLSKVQLKFKDETTFRRALLNRCQEEFERTSRKLEDLPEDPEERLLVKEKERKNKLGNVKFIGELFKFKLLSEKIIHGCIKILFNTIYRYKLEDKESLEMNSELLCKLFATTGKLIDSPAAKTYIDTYFTHISKFSQDPSFSSRIKFMFQGLIEMRENNWTPRREENAPKTISQVHAEALQKEFEDEFESDHPTASISQPAPVKTASIKTTPTPVVESKPTAPDNKKKSKKKKKAATEVKKVEGSGIDEDLEQQISKILKEYLGSGDLEDAKSEIKELKAPNSLAKLVEIGVTFSLERNEKDRSAHV